MLCAVCRSQEGTVGLLCETCRDDVAAPVGLLPNQILATIAKPTGDALIDQWGRAHPLELRTLVGRALDGTGLMILEVSVSRHHAHLVKETAGWRIRDLGSRNGTYVNDAQVVANEALVHGDRIAIGAVGFYLVCEIGVIPDVDVDPTIITTIQSLHRLTNEVPDIDESEDTDVGLVSLPFQLVEPTGGGGGVLKIGDVSVQLSTNQTELVALLSRRMLDEAHQPPQVRGFVRTSELIGSLSWDTVHADDSHVKQLIRRSRRQLIRAGLGDLIESRHRFGYRLRVVPSR